MTALLLAGVALAHPPYEHPVHTFAAPDGPHALVARFEDGIVDLDPTWLELRGADGVGLAATEPTREVATFCATADACTAWQYDVAWLPMPTAIFRVTATGVHRSVAPRLLALGLLVPLAAHPVGHVGAAAALAVPASRLRGTSVARAAVAVLVAVAWTAVVLGTRLSLVHAAALAAAALALRATRRP